MTDQVWLRLIFIFSTISGFLMLKSWTWKHLRLTVFYLSLKVKETSIIILNQYVHNPRPIQTLFSLWCHSCLFRNMDRLQPWSDVCSRYKNNIHLSNAIQCFSHGYTGNNFNINNLITGNNFFLQICKFKVGSFNYPMNKITFHAEV